MGAFEGVPARILALALLAQAVAYYAVASREEVTPPAPSLSAFPQTVGEWTTAREFPLEDEVAEVLKADDTLNRLYVSADGARSVSLFVAFFKTQRFGQAPHSPKNCLPGSGWAPAEDSKMRVSVPGVDLPVEVNKYVIARGDQRSIVLYWYQSHGRAIAGEIAAKFWLVADAVRRRRSDTALVRIVAPAAGDTAAAEQAAVEFLQAAYPAIKRQLPD